MTRELHALAIAVLAAAGCALDWDLAPNPRVVNAPGTVDTSRSATDAGAALRGSPSQDAAPPDAGPDATGDSCSRTTDCASDAYCRFDDELCGTKAAGHCAPRTTFCIDTDDACLCDGTIASRCEGQLAGVDVDVRNGCALRSGKYKCGYAICSVASELCFQTGVDGQEQQFDCEDKSDACTSCASCPRQNCTCSDSSGGLIYTCP